MNEKNSDVLVVGAGMAGFTAAVRACEQGVNVLLIDKSAGSWGGGNVLMASGSLRAGGKSPKAQPDELYDFAMSEGVGNPDLVRAWANTCGRAIDWLIGAGVKLVETEPGRIWLDQQSEISLAPVYKRDVGTRALKSLKDRFLRLGGRYRNGIRAAKLTFEQDRVVGLIGETNGTEIELRSVATILTTGGFGANQEMIKKYIGPRADRCKLRGSSEDSGDGLRMAMTVGAKAVNLQYFYGHLIARKALTDDRFWPYPRLDSFVDEGILIDRHGRRFVDEGRGDVAVANEIARTEDPTAMVLIFDHESWSKSKDSPSSTSLLLPAPNPWLLDQGAELFSHDTVQGLAENLGVSASNLGETVENYNRAVEKNDSKSLAVPRTGKAKILRPPLFGLRVVPGITFTMGGIAVNGYAQVLNQSGEPIVGLYAAGDAIGGLMGGYRGGYTGGLMQAVVTGILAGESAASLTRQLET
jgi:fumarate reductase flavoprotein subunit